MSPTTSHRTRAFDWRAAPAPSQLIPGDRLSWDEFHRLYLRVTDRTKYELIKGIVHMASPLYVPHGDVHVHLAGIVNNYVAYTRGVGTGDSVTTVLDENEVQPDLILRVLPTHGGTCRVERNDEGKETYLAGAPDLVVEVAMSSRAIDMTDKRDIYAEAGVREYIVASLQESRLYWWNLKTNAHLATDKAGVYRSAVFPGLWLDERAVFAGDRARSLALLQEGIDSPEHTRFAQALADKAKSS